MARGNEDSKNSVCYWNMCQPQVETYSTESFTTDDTDDTEYDILYPKNQVASLLAESSFYTRYCVPSNEEWYYHLSSSSPICWLEKILTMLLDRFTNVRANWQKQTLRSFLELGCWACVTYGSWKAYGDILWAIEFGTFIGMIMSICDEVVAEIGRYLFEIMMQYPEGRHSLRSMGFDGKTIYEQQSEVTVFSTILFGTLGFITMSSMMNPYFTMYMAAVGTAFFTVGQLFALWLPTRQIGLTIQSRWTNIHENWTSHFKRSCMELISWIGTSCWIYSVTQHNIFLSVQLSALMGIAICLMTSLEFINDTEWRRVRGQQDGLQVGNALGENLLGLSTVLVQVNKMWDCSN